jgi:hypothetical protein
MENTCAIIGCSEPAGSPQHEFCVACAFEVNEDFNRKVDTEGLDQWNAFDDSES